MSSGVEFILAPIYGIVAGIAGLVSVTAKAIGLVATATKEAIQKEIEEAHRRRYEKWVKEEPEWVESRRQAVNAEIDLELTRLRKAEQECQRMIAQASKTYTALDHTYNLDKEKAKAEEELKIIQEDIAALEKRKAAVNKELDEYLKKVKKSKSYDDIVSRPNSKYEKGRVGDHTIKKMSDRIKELDKRITEFCKVVNDFAEKVQQASHSDFLKRLVKKLDTLDPTDEKALGEIKLYIDDIKREIRSIEAKLLDNSLSAEARKAANEEMMMLQGLLDSLAPIEELLIKYQKLDEESEARAVELFKECVEDIKEIGEMRYVSETTKGEMERPLSILNRIAESLDSENAVTILNNVKEEIKQIKEEAKVLEDRYIRYTKAHDKYVEIHSKYRREDIKRIMGDRYADPESYHFREDEKIEGVIKLLEIANESLEEGLKEEVKRGTIRYFEETLKDKIVSKKKVGETYEIVYTRKEERNVLYVIKIFEDGTVEVGPRGVKLHNGQVLSSRKDLEKSVSTCAWKKSLEEDLEACNMSEAIVVDDERATVYEESDYYQLDNEEETKRFLRKNGYTEEEINRLLYGDSEASETVEESRDEEVAQAIEIDPHK